MPGNDKPHGSGVSWKSCMRGLPASSLETATLAGGVWKDVGKGTGSRAGEFIEWLTVKTRIRASMTSSASVSE